MPLWDNFADQIQKLPTAPAVDASSDRLIYQAADRSFGETAVLTDVPFMLDAMLIVSGTGISPTATGFAKDTWTAPFAVEALELVVTISIANASGTPPSFDFYNITDSLSLVDNTATADAVLTIANTTNNITDAAPDMPTISSPDTVGVYCRQAATNPVSGSWGHLFFWK